jgi:hypothetical protein
MRAIAAAIVFAACIIAGAINPDAWKGDVSNWFVFWTFMVTVCFTIMGV